MRERTAMREKRGVACLSCFSFLLHNFPTQNNHCPHCHLAVKKVDVINVRLLVRVQVGYAFGTRRRMAAHFTRRQRCRRSRRPRILWTPARSCSSERPGVRRLQCTRTGWSYKASQYFVFVFMCASRVCKYDGAASACSMQPLGPIRRMPSTLLHHAGLQRANCRL